MHSPEGSGPKAGEIFASVEHAGVTAQVERLLATLRSYHPSPNEDVVRRAFHFALERHRGQLRKSGEPYIIHPVEVAELVARLKLDEASLCAAILHDVIEDTDTPLAELEEAFGEEVVSLVDGLTKLAKYSFNTAVERQAENFRKMLIAMSRDIRVILIKLADRVHNMRTLEHMSEDKQVRIAQETMDVYAPLANRLGVEWIKRELEDLSLRYLHPDDYADLVAKLAKMQDVRRSHVQDVVGILEEGLRRAGIGNFEVYGRFKNLYSIYRKLRRTNTTFEQLYDIIAFRILVDTKVDCYNALGVAHDVFRPVPGRFKDYIALPKPNMYQSLHTSVMGPFHERIEVQVRTREMHRVAEDGIAAHWKYKEGKIVPSSEEKKFAWLRQLMEWQKDLQDPKEFLETVKIDLFADEVYVFTPMGELRSFPKGSTPLDFAYSIHTEVGNHCIGAKVNDQMVPLKYQLKTGDRINVVTNQHQRPKQDWLSYVVSSRARTKIKQFIHREQRQKSREIGQQLAEKALKRAGTTLARFEKSPEQQRLFSQLKVSGLDDLFVQLGLGKVQPENLTDKVQAILQPQNPDEVADAEADGRLERLVDRIKRRSQTGIVVDGVDDIMVRYAKCCAPVPGEPIVGFVTRGRGVTVHAKSCGRTDELEPERQVTCHWNIKAAASDLRRAVNVRVVCVDQPGMLSNITQMFSNMGINITQAHCRTTEEGRAINAFEVMIKDVKQLQQALRTLARLPGVISAERATS